MLRTFALLGIFLLQSTALAAEPDGKGTQYGPLVCCSVTFVEPADVNARTWDGAVTRAINVKLPGDTTVCFDADRLAVASFWRGGFLNFSRTHHTSYKGNICPRPGAKPLYQDLEQPGWATPQAALDADQLHLSGYYLHGDQIVLSYRIAGRRILELPSANAAALSRSLQVSAGEQAISMLVARAPGKAKRERDGITIRDGEHVVAAKIIGGEKLAFGRRDGNLYVEIPAGDATRFKVSYVVGDLSAAEAFFRDVAKGESTAANIGELIRGGARRWKETFTTAGKLGGQAGAYSLDDLPTPVRPYGSWMRLSAIDFFEDGRAAVATLPGDVWIVSWEDDDISQITWRRFASGLYEPLGLKVVDGEIYVRGRDRITRLHDVNGDGEADYYENFHSHGPIGPGYHAFIFDLNTDKDGNFWYVISGRKAPSIGEVIKLSPDGKRFEVVATHFRHPNGMGYGGPHGWVTISDNDEGKYPAGAWIVRQGQSYGWNGPRTQPFLYVLPPKVDTSSAAQCWADAKRWGPLSGALIHTSYSTSSICYVLTQDTQPNASGFAVHMPFGLKSGPLRLRVNPRDGQMYIACQRGWDSNAAVDGMIHRVRYTGHDAYLVTGAKATKAGVQLTFSCPLDAKTVDFQNFFAARVDEKKETEVDIEDVKLVDERTVLVKFSAADIDPSKNVDRESTKRAAKAGDHRTHYRVIAPLAITFNVQAKDGTPVKDTVYCTINGF